MSSVTSPAIFLSKEADLDPKRLQIEYNLCCPNQTVTPMKLDDESGEDLVTRRDVVTTISTGIMATTVAGSGSLLEAAGSEPEAKHPKALSVEECRMLDALGDTLLPGAAAAGMSRYVNYQLGRETSLLFLNYMDYPGSAIDFYKQGLKALDRQSRVRFNRPFTELNAHEKAELIRNLSQTMPAVGKARLLRCFIL